MFSDNTDKITNSLDCLTYDQLRVLFGDVESFKTWLKNKEIEDIVSINLNIMNGINIIKYSSYLTFIMREVLILFDVGRRMGVLTKFRLKKELIHFDL